MTLASRHERPSVHIQKTSRFDEIVLANEYKSSETETNIPSVSLKQL